MAEVRKRIIFHGRVQGVGFRYTAKYLARSLRLTGWVKNGWIQKRFRRRRKAVSRSGKESAGDGVWIDRKKVWKLQEGKKEEGR